MDSMNKKEQYVVSVINSPVPSISDEMVLRIANKHASNLNVEHVSLVLRSPITESEIIKSYFGKFSSGVVYFDDVKKLDIENFTVVCDNSISENFDDCIVVPVENISLIEHALSGDIESLDRKSTRLNSSHGYISYAVFCLKKKKKKKNNNKIIKK